MNNLPSVCFLCTGNSARSVMARAFFSSKTSEFEATSAGTLVLEGQPMSIRTRKALASFLAIDFALVKDSRFSFL